MNDALDALDPEQLQVATSLDAPMVVLAGAGTGKTRAITHRVANAVREGRYDANATLAVTFTTRAAGEMRGRLAQLGVRTAQARTIHSAALRQCQYFWPTAFGSDFPPILENSFSLVARATASVLRSSETALVRDLDSEISWAKSSNVTADRYAALAAAAGREVSGATPAQVSAVITAYEKAKAASGQVDFSDILLCAASLLAEHPAVAERIRSTYRHFVVDEYQDVSAVQHRLISLWVDGRDDICVVGDPNQAIHSFAGARADFLLGFASERPDTSVVHLVRNYRSTPEILEASNHVLGRRDSRVALRPTKQSGPAPEFHPVRTEAEEAAEVAQWLKAQHGLGTHWSELAVLYRINAQAPSFEAALTDAGVPYSVRGTEKFYDRAEVRQAIVVLGRAAQSEPEGSVPELVEAFLASTGWTSEAPTSMGRQRERWESLNALRSMVLEEDGKRSQWQAADFAAWLTEKASWQSAPVADAVTLSTMHAAKGLEWDGVAVVGVREGLMPFVLCQEEPALSEERRLLHVAFTRARARLRVSWATSNGNRSANRSRFLTGLTSQGAQSATPPASRKKRASLRSKACTVCGEQLHSSAERKLNRHVDCEATHDEALLLALKRWRKETADAASVPAFVVFTDATLQAVAEAEPTSTRELLKLSGIGTVKVERYGQECLTVIAEHVAARG
ncbi:MAG: ATP-dependent DNA helicase UvrD2 [Propionibacteriaceae bacterium]|nr:ATP-dependent DNA helicase UvrD2 [Propionibacteriaceae bacterium]